MTKPVNYKTLSRQVGRRCVESILVCVFMQFSCCQLF